MKKEKERNKLKKWTWLKKTGKQVKQFKIADIILEVWKMKPLFINIKNFMEIRIEVGKMWQTRQKKFKEFDYITCTPENKQILTVGWKKISDHIDS